MTYSLRASCAGDYSSGIVFEADFDGDECFVNYAWEERGLPELTGAHATREAALAVLKEHRDYLEWRGFAVQSY